MAPITSALSGGTCPARFDHPPPSAAFPKRSIWRVPSHLSTVATLSVFLETPPEVGGGWRALKYKFTLHDSAPPRSARREMGVRGRWVDLRDHLILWKGHSKASWKPEGWGTSIWRLFFYLSRQTCRSWCSCRPMVRERDKNLLVLQISSSLPLPLLPAFPVGHPDSIEGLGPKPEAFGGSNLEVIEMRWSTASGPTRSSHVIA